MGAHAQSVDWSNGRHLPQSAGGACVTRLNFANDLSRM